MKNRFYRIGAAALAMSIALSFSAFAGGWVIDNNGWWVQNSNGSFPKNGIFEIGGKEYAFNEHGYMVENAWYEHPKTGEWYFATGSGELAHSQWVGDYYVGNDGAIITDAWVDGYYVGQDGKWVPGKTYEEPESSGNGSSSGSYSGSYEDEWGDLHNPFRDAPLGWGYDNSGSGSSYSSSYSSISDPNSLETKDIRHYDW